MWRFLVTPPASGAENMALDEALMERARQHPEWVLRVYGWSAPTISFGRNQSARGRYDLARIAERGLAVVRRPTGGRAILHHREITYSVTAPVDEAGELRPSYERINRILLAGLRSLGVAAEIAAPSPLARGLAPGTSPCFDVPSVGELVVDDRKLAGSAQWRADGALLQHGSILVEDDQSELAAFVLDAPTDIPAPATLAGLLGHTINMEEAAAALVGAVRATEDPDASALEIDDRLRARTAALVVRYTDADWTWRR